jgi:hypothetical protein
MDREDERPGAGRHFKPDRISGKSDALGMTSTTELGTHPRVQPMRQKHSSKTIDKI